MTDDGNVKWVLVPYLTMRRIVGVLRVALPIVVVVGTFLVTFRVDVEPSISAYADSVMGPAFSGILFVVLIAAYNLFNLDQTRLAAIKPVLLLETFTLWAFGFSWFVKGETLWRDV